MASPRLKQLWTRRVDVEAYRTYWRLWMRWLGAPTVVLTIATANWVGLGESFGVVILMGSLSVGVALMLWLSQRTARLNGAILLGDDGVLHCGNHRIRTSEIVAWTTRTGMEQTFAAGNRQAVTLDTAELCFSMGDDVARERHERPAKATRVERIKWVNMTAEELEEVRGALAGRLPVPWVKPEAFRDEAV
ncbi:MAG: hypothetical protein ACON5B_10590 [Myxococcota bacterium]